MDTMNEAKELLRELYDESSKHAQYQTLPDALAERLGVQFDVNEAWRGDRPRYPIIRKFITEGPAKSIVDFGANIGFFSLSLAEDFPDSEVTACELNPTHAHIIRLLAKIGGYTRFNVTEQAVDLQHAADFGKFDVALHLNILHHAGHDFDRTDVPDIASFSAYAVEYLRKFRATAARMVFQMGYNWGGNKELPLVQREDQAGKIRFTVDLFEKAGWTIEHVAIAKSGAENFPVEYELVPTAELFGQNDLQAWLIKRYGETVWSEFYQRPLWLCKTKT